MPSQEYIPYINLPSFLGIKPGEIIMIASDITRMSMTAIRQEGKFNPEDLIDSFIEKLGEEGSLIIPSFNFNLKDGERFDVKKSVPVTGALAETALERGDFIRTLHPLHSFLVQGKYAVDLAAMDNISSFGKDSPFAFFKEKDVLMLMLGTSVTDAFTFVHYVEELEDVKYRNHINKRIKYFHADGREEWKEITIFAKKPGWTMNLASLEKLFREKGILIESSFNGVPCTQVRLGKAFPIIREDIFNNKARNISRFSPKLFFREVAKKTLSSLHLYSTLTEKISHDPGPR
jgi:aminoglycoside 3-N-acetyltransferase